MNSNLSETGNCMSKPSTIMNSVNTIADKLLELKSILDTIDDTLFAAGSKVCEVVGCANTTAPMSCIEETINEISERASTLIYIAHSINEKL
jgi:hypothetical protein